MRSSVASRTVRRRIWPARRCAGSSATSGWPANIRIPCWPARSATHAASIIPRAQDQVGQNAPQRDRRELDLGDDVHASNVGSGLKLVYRRSITPPTSYASTPTMTRSLRQLAVVGATSNRLETAGSRLLELEESQGLLSETEDADMAKAMVDFSMHQSVYQAALKSART